MSNYYFHLTNTSVKHPLSEIGQLWFDALPEECHVDIPKGYFSDELLSWLDTLGLYIFDGEVFSMPANYQLQIHVDGTYFQEKCKLNWAYSEGEHYNTWYTPKPTWKQQSTAETQTDGRLDDYSFVFESDEVNEVARCTLNNPTVVCSGQPHSVITTTHPRKSVSVTVFPKGCVPQLKDWGMQYNELREVLHEYIL